MYCFHCKMRHETPLSIMPFEASIEELGDKLVRRIGTIEDESRGKVKDNQSEDCSWNGYCKGEHSSSLEMHV